jgi:hypothetical protein
MPWRIAVLSSIEREAKSDNNYSATICVPRGTLSGIKPKMKNVPRGTNWEPSRIGSCSTWNIFYFAQNGSGFKSDLSEKCLALEQKNQEVFHRFSFFALPEPQPRASLRKPSPPWICRPPRWPHRGCFPQLGWVLHKSSGWPQTASPFTLESHG